MIRTPSISIQGWGHDGPQYTIHRSLDGFRNRKARRAGESADELVGDHDATVHDEPASSMLFADGDLETWGYAKGHAYLVTLLIDGDAANVLVDAREDHRIEHYQDGISLLEVKPLSTAELEELLEEGVPEASNISDGAESQEPITSLTGAQIGGTPESRDAAYVAAADELFGAPSSGTPTDETLTDETIESTQGPDLNSPGPRGFEELHDLDPTGSVDGRFEELEAKYAADQITDVELEELGALQDAATAPAPSLDDDEDAVGGNGDSASDEEE